MRDDHDIRDGISITHVDPVETEVTGLLDTVVENAVEEQESSAVVDSVEEKISSIDSAAVRAWAENIDALPTETAYADMTPEERKK